MAGQKLILSTLNLIKIYKNDNENNKENLKEKNEKNEKRLNFLTINTNIEELNSNNLFSNSYDLYNDRDKKATSSVIDRSISLSRSVWILKYAYICI